jgi:HNH endonuclease/AP2 domain
MKEIKLTQGKFAIVDDEDFERVNQYKWCFQQGYALRGQWIKGEKITKIIGLHRFIMNPKKDEFIDHINGNGLDNRKENLRIVTKQQNAFNSNKPITNTSGYKGVSFFRRDKKWRAVIKLNQKYVHIGYFDDKITAAKAYDKKAKELFGNFAKLNYAN